MTSDATPDTPVDPYAGLLVLPDEGSLRSLASGTPVGEP